jgi:N-acetylmuramoyl-L-alanine amidase
VLNLQVAEELQRQLASLGIRAALTRTGDYRLPIVTRAEIANVAKPKVFVSVHHNAGAAAGRSDPGTEVYFQHSSASSKRLAGLIWESLVAALRSVSAQWVGASDAGAIYRLGRTGNDFYGVLRDTHVPAVLIEPAYMSNASEAHLLSTASFRTTEAKAIADGIHRYLTTRDPGGGFHQPLARAFSDAGGGGTDNCTDPALA